MTMFSTRIGVQQDIKPCVTCKTKKGPRYSLMQDKKQTDGVCVECALEVITKDETAQVRGHSRFADAMLEVKVSYLERRKREEDL